MALPRKIRLKKRADANQMQCRAFAVAPASLDLEKRSVEAVFATEQPVMEYCYDRHEYLPTVLLMSGCQLPKDRSLVMLDNHERHGEVAKSIKGSGNNVKVENRELVGTLVFSSGAENEWTLAREGHLKAVSIGRVDHAAIYVAENTKQRVDGREWQGPVLLVERWTPKEISLTPVGADKDAVLRNETNQGRESDQEPNAREQNRSAQSGRIVMNAILKALLVARGLKKDATDDDAVVFLVERGMPTGTDPAKIGEWVEANMAKLEPAPVVPRTEPAVVAPRTEPAVAPVAAQAPAVDVEGIAKRMFTEMKSAELKERKALEQHLKTRNESLKWDDATINRILMTSANVQDADNAVFEEIANRAGPQAQIGNSPITGYGQGQADKVDGLLKTAISMRTLESTCKSPETVDRLMPKENRQQGWEQFRYASLIQMAAFSVRQSGVNPDFMSPEDIAKTAILGQRSNGGFRIRAGAYHTPGSFPYILMDAINKNVQAAYSEAPSTCEVWMRIAPSVPDFKNINVIKLGATPNLQDWDGYSNFATTSFKDEKETYAVQAKAERVPISWMTLVNDDQNALSMIPARLGAAARRTRNQMAYTQLTSGTSSLGRTMSDGQQLFSTATGNRAKSNLSTGAGAPSVTTVQTQTNLMMQMRGLNTPEEAVGEDILGTQPAFIIGPSALRTTILQLVRSTADPASGGNSGVYNPTQGLIPIIEPFLDGQTNGTTAWFLASRWQDCPHIEITHLVGQETPVIESWVDDGTKCLNYDCLQTMAACAVEHRGLVRHSGA